MQTGRGYKLRHRGLTLLEVSAVVLALVILLVLVPMFFSRPRGHGHPMTRQLRGIHQGLVTFANSNKEHFPGLDSKGNVINGSVEYRFQVLIENSFSTPSYVISPSETAKITPWVEPLDSDADVAVTLTTANYSYAMLDMDQPGERQAEWSQSLNTDAIVMSDRNTSRSASKPTSIHSGTDPWEGSVLWNDNHVTFESTHLLSTRYGSFTPPSGHSVFSNDNIFSAAGSDDAWMIYSGD